MNRMPAALVADRIVRPPPAQAVVLLPVWGEGFVRRFLDFSLPTLLAPGNLPAVADRLPTRFLFLTRERDRPLISGHPAYGVLAASCEAEIRSIDHLIARGNHSTSITLAYAEAVRAEGEAVTDTCFFFLVSDYLMADGSLTHVLDRIEGGASAVQAGNFQIRQKAAQAWLAGQLRRAPGRISLPPRDLVRWGLAHLHPVTVANIVNQPLSHAEPANRLFWRVDGGTLLGRFYLLHMIAIRPTKADFMIGASCDYSFVPEMAVGGRVETITDSDDYLVLEMQPRGHEGGFVRPGPLLERRLARSLGQWTTAGHRENAAAAIVFHAGERSTEGWAAAMAEADGFVARVAARLPARPQPHRGHPYWDGAIAAFKEATGQPLSRAERRLALGLPHPGLAPRWLRPWMIGAIDRLLHGGRSGVRPWHPRWPEYRRLAAILGPEGEAGGRLLLVSNARTVPTARLPDGGRQFGRVQASRLAESFTGLAPRLGRFDRGLVEVADDDLPTVDMTLDCVAGLVRPGGRIVLLVNCNAERPPHRLPPAIAARAGSLVRPRIAVLAVEYVQAGGLRWRAAAAISRRLRAARLHPGRGVPLLALAALPLGAAQFLGNLLSLPASRTRPRGASAALVTLIVEESPAEVDGTAGGTDASMPGDERARPLTAPASAMVES